MSVPDTEMFSIMDIITELGGGLTSLQACFDIAMPFGFDSNYNNDNYAPANSMLRFRNYVHEGIVATITIPAGSTSASSVTFTQITPISGGNLYVDWGDGDTFYSPAGQGGGSNISHTYSTTDEKTIDIRSNGLLRIINTTGEVFSDVQFYYFTTNGGGVILTDCGLTTALVNQILIALDAIDGLTSGQVSLYNQSPSAPPSGAGITASASLTAKGLNVQTD